MQVGIAHVRSHCVSKLSHLPAMCSFCRNFAKLCSAPGFWENVLDSFSDFYIEIAYSNFIFCGAYTSSFLARHTILAKRTHPRGCFFGLSQKSIAHFIIIVAPQVKLEAHSAVSLALRRSTLRTSAVWKIAMNRLSSPLTPWSGVCARTTPA